MPNLSDYWPFIATFVGLIFAGIGLPPIPEEVVVAGAGIWAAGKPELGPTRWLILAFCIAGILVSDLLLYGIGRFGGARLLGLPWMTRVMTPERRQHIEHNFHRYGLRILLFVRWLPGIRSPMFITAGLMRLPVVRFVIADAVAASVGHLVIFTLAYWFGDQFKELLEQTERQVGSKARPILVLVGIAAITGYLLLHLWRRPVTEADPKEVPLIGEQVAATIEPADPEPSGPASSSPDATAGRTAPHQADAPKR